MDYALDIIQIGIKEDECMNKIIQSPVNRQGMFVENSYAIDRRGNANTDGKKQGSTIFAGSLTLNYDPIMEKRKKAQEEAMKLIKDVFKDDLKEFDGLKEREQHIEQLKQANKDNKGKLADIEGMRESLREEYGITDDSQEEQDLELIRKAQEAENPSSFVKLTEEEQERYQELKQKGYTPYQQKSLSFDADAAEINKKMKDNERDIALEMDAIDDTLMNRLKTHKMFDARNSADVILEAARKETIGALVNEAKEHIDETAEEEKKKQEERIEQEKKEKAEETERELKKIEQEIALSENEEKAKARAAQRAGQAKADVSVEGIEDMQGVVNKTNDAAVNGMEQEIKELLERMKLLQEDLKGAAVDGTV